MNGSEVKLQEDAQSLVAFSQDAKYLADAFYHVFGRKLVQEGYVDCRWLLSSMMKASYYSRLKLSELRHLYTKGCVPSENVELMEQYLENMVGEPEKALTALEEEALVAWLLIPYQGVAKKSQKRKYLQYLLEGFALEWNWKQRKGSKRELHLQCELMVMYDEDICRIKSIESVGGFAKDISELKEACRDSTLFYRGHSRLDYELLPSIMRNEGWMRNEKKMYQELRVRCAQDFAKCESHLDELVEMQHYGMPTRLLDITENPLVALYFACCSNEQETGEVILLETVDEDIRYAKSDTVAVLAALPTLSHDVQEDLRRLCNNGLAEHEDAYYERLAGKLAAEIKSRNPAFEPRIRKEDLMGHVFVTPLRRNPRIMKQDGSFILCGLGDGAEENNSLRELRYLDAAGLRVIFVVRDKESILEELDLFSVNRATLFPEIDDVAEYIKLKYR